MNGLASITPSVAQASAFSYDASGNILTDARLGALAMTFAYDENGRLANAFQTAHPQEGGSYTYDASWRLATRTITHAAAPTSTVITYIHDLDNHIIAETDGAGAAQREYVWLGDLPVAAGSEPAGVPVAQTPPRFLRRARP